MFRKKIVATAVLATGLVLAAGGITTSVQAVIVGPYTPDADTLHLWHFDKDFTPSPSNAPDSVSPGGVPVGNQNGATWGNSAFTGFDKSGDTSAAANSIIRSSATNPLTAPVGADGAFTYEAMINVSTTSGSQQIFAMDSNGALDTRPFWFRIINGDLHFFNVAKNDTDNRVPIPTTGDDAFVANEWFHAAVTYDGNEGTADNLKFYWTRVDDSRAQANLIGSATIDDLSTTATAVYGIGNAFRVVGSGVTANLEGLIDEVRISSIARSADDMLFGTPDQPGDFNGDGTVEAADLALLLGNWGQTTQPGDWPTNWDNFVDANELADLLGNWGAGLDAAPLLDMAAIQAVVPEPATMTLLALSGGLAALRRRK